MTEPSAFNLTEAALPDGTVDFYTLIGKTPDSDAESIRQRIQALYSEATANRDNRNLKKRREYQALLELLPPARAALLEPSKRARYDDFLVKARSGAAPSDFEEFINDLMGFNDQMEEKTGLLATKDKAAEPRASVINTPTPRPAPRPTTSAPRPTPTAPRPTPVPSNAYSTGNSKQATGASKNGILGGVMGLLLGILVGFIVFKGHIFPAILTGIIIAAVAFVLFNGNGKGGNRISS